MKRYTQYLFAGIFLLVFMCSALLTLSVHAQDIQAPSQVSTFDELKAWLQENQSTGGTVALTQDLTVPAGETYEYLNARYRKEVTIQTQGHTIYVEGCLDFWPFLTIVGDGSQNELFHVCPGGELRLTSISLDAGEDGVAIVQEEGSFLIYGSEVDMGLPEFSCIGQIISPQTVTAAADWYDSLERLPVVRVPAGESFSEDLLPETVLAKVNRDHSDCEEKIPVVWDSETFPAEENRTLVSGTFDETYAAFGEAVPKCLVVWESASEPFFLNVYLERVPQRYDVVYMYAETSLSGEVRIQFSEDGETWQDITGTDGYEPIEASESETLSWILFYPQTEPVAEMPRYYRLMQLGTDGTPAYSDIVELSDDLIFTAADIDGGRGGETSPNEGDDQLPETEIPASEPENITSEPQIESGSLEMQIAVPEKSSLQSQPETSGSSEDTEKNLDSLEGTVSSQPQENQPQVYTPNVSGSEQVDSESISPQLQIAVGISVIIAILAVSVGTSVYLRKNRNE